MATSITQSGVALPHSTPRGARHLRPRSTSARAAARSRHRSGDRITAPWCRAAGSCVPCSSASGWCLSWWWWPTSRSWWWPSP